MVAAPIWLDAHYASGEPHPETRHRVLFQKFISTFLNQVCKYRWNQVRFLYGIWYEPETAARRSVKAPSVARRIFDLAQCDGPNQYWLPRRISQL